jgi:amino acid transporter
MNPDNAIKPKLKRALGLPMLTLYGLGTTIGAGIYALLGEVAGTAGYGAPLSFLVASLVAGFTACSFAELSSRFPRAAGAALYVQQGFKLPKLGTVVGLLVVASGLVSAAALVNGFYGYLQEFIALEESVTVAATITLVEIGGLVMIVAISGEQLGTFQDRWSEFLPGTQTVGWLGIFVGVTLAFYAFIGFEDMVDVAEEVKNVRRNMPLAILCTLGISTGLYFLLMVSALLSLTPAELAVSAAPMAALYEANTGQTPVVIGFIAMFAIINGSLVQIVMVSRVVYGLSSRGQLPAALGRVNSLTLTPLYATGLATLLLMILALSGRLAALATATSVIMLTIFVFVNLSLWRIKGTQPAEVDTLTFPRFVPACGAILSAGFVAREVLDLLVWRS